VSPRVYSDQQGFQEVLDALRRMRQALPSGLKALALRMVRKVQVKALENINNNILKIRTGGLFRFVSAQRVVTGEGWASWGLPSNAESEGKPYSAIGRIQDTGGIIRPVNAKALTIPLPAALSASGANLYGPRSGHWGKLFSAKGMLWQDRGKGKDPVALFVFKQSVRIREKKWFRTPAEEAAASTPEEIGRTMRVVLKGEGVPDG